MTVALRRFAGRAALVVAGCVVGLALVELSLQLAAWVAPSLLLRGGAGTAGSGAPRVLFVGDSHVYGAWVSPGQALPEQVERGLRTHGVPVEVHNLGIPGQNSAQVLRRLPAQLAAHQPALVVVWVGANNYWNLVDRDVPAARETVALPWWERLRLVRLLRVVRVGLRDGSAAARRPRMQVLESFAERGQRLAVEGPDGVEVVRTQAGGAELDAETAARALASDLTAAIAAVRAAGAQPVLVTYPAPLTPERVATNRAIAEVAAAADVPCLETEQVLRRLQRRGVERLFFWDLHPRERLYRAIGWELARRLAHDGLVGGTTARHAGARRLPAGRCR